MWQNDRNYKKPFQNKVTGGMDFGYVQCKSIFLKRCMVSKEFDVSQEIQSLS